MFDFLKRKQPGKEPEFSAIWEEPDENHFVTELSARVAEKCAYGDDFSALSPAERVFYLAQLCEEEVNNGGFDQLFFNAGSCRRPFGPSARQRPRISAPGPWRPWDRRFRRIGRRGRHSWSFGRRNWQRRFRPATRPSFGMRRIWRP